METPMLDKMLKIQKESDQCAEFLDWFLSRYAVFEKALPRENAFVDPHLGDTINKEKLLADFFEIDLQEVEREKTMLLQEMRKTGLVDKKISEKGR